MIDYGFLLSLIASIIALYGVYQFNQLKDYCGARHTWFLSNSIFMAYFAGRVAMIWDGGVGDFVMFLYFALMWGSNTWGMK